MPVHLQATMFVHQMSTKLAEADDEDDDDDEEEEDDDQIVGLVAVTKVGDGRICDQLVVPGLLDGGMIRGDMVWFPIPQGG
jgi:hypothetical protein